MKLLTVPMSQREANEFVANYHRHNLPPRGALFQVGASDGERLVGVAIVGRPVARLLQDGFTAEVTRCCVLPAAPKGSCSFLYGACWRAARALGYRKLVTYTLAEESGAEPARRGVEADRRGDQGARARLVARWPLTSVATDLRPAKAAMGGRLMPKHTPGPWKVEDPIHGVLSIVVGDTPAEWRDVAQLGLRDADMPAGVVRANARLISAAPDLLACAEDFLRLLTYTGDDAADFAGNIEDRTRAAIAKATGIRGS
jgi:hypothetical protein